MREINLVLLHSEIKNIWNAKLLHTYLQAFPSGEHYRRQLGEAFYFRFSTSHTNYARAGGPDSLPPITASPFQRVHFIQPIASESDADVLSRVRVTSVFLNRVVTLEANHRLESSLSYS